MPLTCEQQRVVEHVSGHLVVIAGPGSGKTRTVIEKIRYILDQDIIPPPYRLLIVTFSNVGVAEIKKRLGAGGFRYWDRIRIATFHSFANHILTCFGSDIGIPENFELIVEEQQEILDEIAQRHAIQTRALRGEISKCKRRGRYPDQSGIIRDDMLLAYQDYQTVLRNRKALDLDDLIVYALRLLKESALARRLFTSTYRYILVDEFQDSDPLQLQLVTIFAESAIGTTVVGDDDQSIYAFRGAERRNIEVFANSVSADRMTLEANFRSDQVILEAAQAVISQERNRVARTLKGISSSRGILQKCSFDNEVAEASYLSAEIHRLIEQEKTPHSEIAVLARVSDRLNCICYALEKLSIPYFDRRSLGFRQSLTTDLALALLEIRADLSSSAALSRLLEVVEGANLHAFYDEPDGIDAALRLKSQAASLAEPTLQESGLETYLASVGFLDIIQFASDNDRVASRIMNDISSMCNTIVSISQQHGLSLLDTLARLRGEDAVQIMTGHASKGTEYDHVLLVGLEKGTLPYYQAKTEEEMADERRIFYVAVTRARRAVYLTYVETLRDRWGRHHRKSPSQFLAAIPDECFL